MMNDGMFRKISPFDELEADKYAKKNGRFTSSDSFKGCGVETNFFYFLKF